MIKELCFGLLELIVTNAAKALGISRKTSSSILSGHSGIGAEMAACLFICSFIFFFSGNIGAAETLLEQFLQIDGKVVEDGSSVEISWPKVNGTKNGRVNIQRRILGQTNKVSWQSIASVRSVARVYRDKTSQPGVAYEYRISRPSKERIETGYWVAGRNVPVQEHRGVAIVIVDKTLAGDLAPRLDRFMLDLIGDGWKVVRHDVPRGNDKDLVKNLQAARKLRARIKRNYYTDPSAAHTLILVGHLPIVKSGRMNPDGHKRRPLETDLFYADMDGVWRDNGQGILQHNAIPSDHIEMQVGRIDFSNLDGALGDEITLLKRYFDKNHHWRHGHLGDLRQAYGDNNNLSGETNALRNIVGPKEIIKGGHHDVGKQQPWLFGVDFGSWKYSDYTSTTPIKTVFSINFGSGKLNFSQWNNTMKIMLAQKWYGIATGWGGRPTWQLNHMALGKSIGYSHLRTVNNGTRTFGGADTLEYTPTGNYTWLNPVWVNLLGDPTLHPFPSEPVRRLQAKRLEGGVQLNWVKADDKAEVHYRIYRALDRFGSYQALKPSKLHVGHQFVDSNPVPGAWYMVRAHSLKNVYAGSFYTFSQGIFTSVDNVSPKATDQLISTSMGQKIKINLAGTDSDSDKDLITSFINGPEGGRLVQSNGDWFFIPDAKFTGRVNIPFTIFDGIVSDDGMVSINVEAP